jgi:septal ring factor EnvC (AmiA/AmiB activator)
VIDHRLTSMILLLTVAMAATALAQSRLDRVDRRLDNLAVAQVRSGLEAGAQRLKLDEISRREAALTVDLTQRRGELSKLLGALAMFHRQPPPALLVSPPKARDAVRGAILARALTPELTRRARALAVQLEQVAVLRRDAAAANAALFSAQSEQAERSALIDQTIEERAALKPAGVDLGPLSEGGDGGALRINWPLSGRVARRFGESLPSGGKASGLSIAAKKGDLVLSPAAGTAQFVGPVPGWGIVLILKVKGAYHLVLGGLEQVQIQNGQSVATGTPVGRLPTGARSSPELYMELRENGAPVDPARWMPGAQLGISPQ